MDRQQTVETMKSRLDKWNADLDALEQKAGRVSDEKKAEYRATIAELKEKKARAEGELRRLQDSSDEAFGDLSRGLEQAWERLSDSLRDARKRFN